ncbi:MAG: AAA family ATPase [Pseudomonadota bacterium]
MLQTLAINNYRSLKDLVVPLASVNVITGPNGSGKSNLYKALRLLAATAGGGVINALAREGGLQSTFWAGPEQFSRDMTSGAAPIQGTRRTEPVRLRMGFASEDFSYAISLGLPVPDGSRFSLDPVIKRETVWSGPLYRPAAGLVDRKGPVVKVRAGRSWQVVEQHVATFESMFRGIRDLGATTELLAFKHDIEGWRFYDHLRTDAQAPARQVHLGTRTPVLDDQGQALAAAWQTILEIGDAQALAAVVEDAFPGASVEVAINDANYFTLLFKQHGLLRPLSAAELSDGTLRYLLWAAALLTPRPPPLMILNEPETSLHPDLLPALGRLIIRAAESSQIWVVTHAPRLVHTLAHCDDYNELNLEKTLGETTVFGQGALDQPAWNWPD